MNLITKTILCLSCLLLIGINGLQAQTTITAAGTVKSEDGSALSGASITQKNGKAATVSNQDGYFTLKVQKGAVLVVSYIGYASSEIVAGESMNVSLTPNSNLLADIDVVVDKGYGKSKRIAVSSSISSVSGKELQNQTGYNVGTLLQGKATGVQVTNTAGGYPKILIRGFTTLNTNTDP